MEHDRFSALSHLSDDEVRAAVQGAARRNRLASVELITHLAEVESRSLHLADGYGSMFVYCTKALGFSEDEAYNRVEVARAARRFPCILELLAPSMPCWRICWPGSSRRPGRRARPRVATPTRVTSKPP